MNRGGAEECADSEAIERRYIERRIRGYVGSAPLHIRKGMTGLV